tara:strand:- start:464 stop:1765 length:1302 start_codon:yes stop_codon:yes gene_type:complete
MDEEKLDCIIVGAGPAGCAAAITLARGGANVVVLEKGESPGSKNLFGGILFTTVLNKLIPDFLESAPLERHVLRRKFGFIFDGNETTLELRSEKFNRLPFNNTFTVLRSKFDKWFATQAEKAGAQIFSGITVDNLIEKKGKVVGIKAKGGDELFADVVINAEGANSLLAERTGMRKLMIPNNRVLTVKEIIKLPKETIGDRFSLKENEGASVEFFGEAVKGMKGSAFIYTNKESISIGIGCTMDEMIERSAGPNGMLEHFKELPTITNYIKGGELLEYSTHMIPEDGYDNLPKLFKNGLLMVGDSAGLINPSLYHEGTNLAMASGICAGETILEAKKRKDFSENSLSEFQKKLEESFVLKDMKHYRKFLSFITNNRQFIDDYPKIFMELLIDYFTINEMPKKEVRKAIIKKFLKNVNLLRLLYDMWRSKDALV